MRRRLGLVLVVLGLVAACSTTERYEPLAVPEGSDDLPATSSTVPPDLDEVALPAVEGTTTTAPPAIRPGPATIVGRVDGPDGPVGNALVRLERLGESGPAALVVPTATDGTWNASDVLGGRYRIRAWKAPALGMLRAQVLFVESPRAQAVVLRLDRFEATRFDAVIAPDPPVVDEEANMKVRITTRGVTSEGLVRYQPAVGINVRLTGSGAWEVLSSNPTFTDSEGSATFRLECLEEGAQPLSVTLDDGETEPLGLPPCV